jgi:GNAT superfamily N-acetyltransferase
VGQDCILPSGSQIENLRHRARDIDAIVPLWREMMELHQQLEPLNWTIGADANDTFRSYLGKCLDDPDRLVAVAVCAGEIVGYLHAAKTRRLPLLESPVEGTIEGCCVARDARRRGVGRMLVAEAMTWFRAQGLTVAKAGYALANPLSGPFWNALGFRPCVVIGIRPVASEEAP